MPSEEFEDNDGDRAIQLARQARAEVVERLKEVALADPATHVSIAAGKLLLEIAAQKTSEEKDPFGVLQWPPR